MVLFITSQSTTLDKTACTEIQNKAYFGKTPKTNVGTNRIWIKRVIQISSLFGLCRSICHLNTLQIKKTLRTLRLRLMWNFIYLYDTFFIRCLKYTKIHCIYFTPGIRFICILPVTRLNVICREYLIISLYSS